MHDSLIDAVCTSFYLSLTFVSYLTHFSDLESNSNKMNNSIFFLNIIVALIAIIPTILYHYLGKSYQRGFFCDDESLWHPYHGSTVTTATLVIVSMLIPPIAIIIIESFLSPEGRKGKKKVCCVKVPFFVLRMIHYFIMYLFGCALTQTLVDTAKFNIGR